MRAEKSGFAVLGVKADELPIDVDDAKILTSILKSDVPIDKAVTVLATEKPVLLVIDQLDALADLMDLKTGRLNAILQLINSCYGIPRVHIVCSCRELEFRRDARLSGLDADHSVLQLPPWDKINHTLETSGIHGAAQWPAEFRSILQTPQYLDVFLRRHRETGS
ncbi:MAG: hypothetical protein B7Z55_07930, partial [Planctomycetales bacterium 12-60-4]